MDLLKALNAVAAFTAEMVMLWFMAVAYISSLAAIRLRQ